MGVMSSEASLAQGTRADSFTAFVDETERNLKRALVAGFGQDRGPEAAAEAWAHCWEHWDRVREMDNPAGYVFGVGRNKARAMGRNKRPALPSVPTEREQFVEPGLPLGLGQLSERQRVAVMLKHGYGWTYVEVSELLGLSIPTIQKHAERGMAKLRKALGVEQ